MEQVDRAIAVVNQKGGVGKTTTAVNLAAGLAFLGKRVMLVDIDPQGNATSGVGVEKAQLEQCIYDVLMDDAVLQDVKVETGVEGLELIPATIRLAGAEIELVSALSREFKLRKALEVTRRQYDYILIDCPPSLGLLTINAMTAADSALVPIQCEYYALEGLSQLLNSIKLVQKHLNSGLKIEGVLLTMFDARTNLGMQVVEEVKEYFGGKVYETVIPRNVRLSEAPSFGQPIMVFDPRSRGAYVYKDLAKEVIGNERQEA